MQQALEQKVHKRFVTVKIMPLREAEVVPICGYRVHVVCSGVHVYSVMYFSKTWFMY